MISNTFTVEMNGIFHRDIFMKLDLFLVDNDDPVLQISLKLTLHDIQVISIAFADTGSRQPGQSLYTVLTLQSVIFRQRSPALY